MLKTPAFDDNPLQSPARSGSSVPAAPRVKHFRQVLLWPLRLMPVERPGGGGSARAKPWQILRDLNSQAAAGNAGPASPWREQVEEYTGAPDQFHERHYNEFVTFLPYVQRFLYGEGRTSRGPDALDKGREGRGDGKGDGQSNGQGRAGAQSGKNAGHSEADSPMRIFRRTDVAQVRVQAKPGEAPITLDIVHTDLYFFLDVDLVLLNVEVSANDLSLAQAQEILYRFGRGYPAGWDAQGLPLHCMANVEWLGAQGEVLSRSDAQDRDAFLTHVAQKRAPRIAAHWGFLLEPLVGDHSGREGLLRYRQIEYYRMPLMGYLAVDNPRALTRSDFVRLALVTGAGAGDGTFANEKNSPEDACSTLPYAEQHLADFETRYCYDRFWASGGAAPNTRYLCSGHSMIVVGEARSEFYGCRDRGVLAQFRHQHFLLFLIAHFQKASLLMFSDRLVEALKNLTIDDPGSVRRFKRAIRASFEGFLRFTHRYWFHEVAEQAQARALFHMTASHLGLDPLYLEVKERIADMNSYLDADSLRRQANTVVRLTVVTIFGLIGTVTTGFLGMNLLAEAEAPLSRRITIFSVVFVTTTALTIYTMAKSKRLSDFLDALSDERLSVWQKAKSLAAVWRAKGD